MRNHSLALDGYILGPLIARGGMAEVYLAKALGRQNFERLFAVKRILPHYAQDPDFVAMFRDEANIVRRLQHANIVQVVDFDEIGGSAAMIMELVEGVDLRALLAACEKSGTRMSVPHCLYIAREVARALSYAHKRKDDATGEPLNLVHRDISPQNILISYAGEIKIIDFGVARIAAAKLNETKPGTVKGKYSYMSPEQVSAKDLDGRSDVFSLGIVLWEILAMRRLFNGDTEVDTIRRVQECRIPEALSKLNQDVTEELQRLVEKALTKESEQRYATAGEFERALSLYLNQNYPGFSASELGAHVGRLTSSRKSELQRNIRKTWALTAPPAQKSVLSLPAVSQSPSMQMTGTDTRMSRSPLSANTSMQPTSRGSGSSRPPTSSHAKLKDAYAASYRSSRHPMSNESLVTGPLRSMFARSRTMAAQHFIRDKIRSSLNPTTLLLVALTAVTIIGVGYMLLNLPQRPDNPLVKFELTTTPARVQLQVDGEPRFDGRYVATPLTLKIPPGKRKVSVIREGHRTITFTINGDPGQTLKSRPVQLRADNKVATSQLKLVAKRTGSFRFNLDEGFYLGSLPSPILLIPQGKDRRLIITDDRGIETRCLIRSKNLQSSKALVVTYDNSGTVARCTLGFE